MMNTERGLSPRALAATTVAVLTLLAGGCRQEDVAVRLHFPNETTFLYSDTVRLVVVEVEPEDRNACSEVLQTLSTGTIDGAFYDSGPVDACAFQAGELVIESLPDGTHAYAVVSLERDSATVLLSGCAVRDVRVQERQVQIDLRTSTHYNQVYPALPPGCTVAQRCNEACVPGS